MSECKHETWNSVSAGLKWACGECGKFESDIVNELRQQLEAERAKRIAWELSTERAEATIAAMRGTLETIVSMVATLAEEANDTEGEILCAAMEALSKHPITEYVRTDNLGNRHYKMSQCSCSANDWVLINGKFECNFCEARLCE